MGVNHVIIGEEDKERRIDRWFKQHYPDVPYGAIAKAMRTGQIKVNKKKIAANYRLCEGDEIRIPPFSTDKPARQWDGDPRKQKQLASMVLFEDQEIMVLNKPSGLAVQGGSKVKESIDDFLAFSYPPEQKPKLVHRIDKDTSGLLVLAKHRKAAEKFTKAFKDKKVQKIYLAIVVGAPTPQAGEINLALDVGLQGDKEKMIPSPKGKKAITHYRVIDDIRKLALVELSPLTGRKHQLRAHMVYLNTPILGDLKYGGSQSHMDGLPQMLHLHAYQLFLPGYKNPFEAPLPKHIKQTLKFTGMSIQ